MRPFRSFLLLLIFLACFTGLYYIFPESELFPPITEFLPESIIGEPGSVAGDSSFTVNELILLLALQLNKHPINYT